MNLFNGVISITGIGFLMFVIFIVAGLGYLLGRVTIKGVSLGTAGVFIIEGVVEKKTGVVDGGVVRNQGTLPKHS